ncbi:MAG: hypothetical protein ABL986_17925 [Vicinamibacterales bacterium]
MSLKTSAVLSVVLVWLAVAGVSAQVAPPDDRAAFLGSWSLNRELSGAAPSPDLPGRQGRRGGGFSGGFGGGRGGRGQNPQSAGEARAENERLVALLQELVTPETRLRIARGEGDVIALTSADGRTARYLPNGKTERHQQNNGTIETQTTWQQGELRQELSGPGGIRVSRTFAIERETDQLIVSITTPEGRGGGQQRPFRAVYDRDAEGASLERPSGVNVSGALVDSLKIVLMEHGIRIAFQDKTRRELKGPFWSDYVHSLKVPRQWEDTDNWWVNYIGHPIHGAAAGYVWLEHDRGAPPDLSLSRAYWSSRAKAFAWAAGYSLQFEIGPLSEASIGNVGLKSETTGWVDHVVTPVGAFGLIVAEDALDRYLVRWIERRTQNRVFRAILRLAFNPGRTLSNSTTGRLPWYRQGRPLGWK